MGTTTSTILREAYTPYYASRNASDSPDKSRLSMARRIADFVMTHAAERPTILDVGAGMQSVEVVMRMLGNSASGRGRYAGLNKALADTHFMTLDIAAEPKRKQRMEWSRHMIGDMAALPLRNASIDLVVSNLALDMLRRDQKQFGVVLQSVSEVVRPHGAAFFNFHHSSLFPTLCDFYQGKRIPQTEFYDAQRDNPYYDDPETIARELGNVGFESTVNLQADGVDVWWEVEAMRAPTLTQ